MKVLRNLIFTLFAVAGLALSVSAQKDDKGKRPPKADPPKVEPAEKNRPRENPPPRQDRPKKPGMEFSLVLDGKKVELA
jgi:hypothetical protein